MRRGQSQIEIELGDILKERKNIDPAVPEKVSEIYSNQPIFDLATMISSSKIVLDESLKIGILKTKNSENTSKEHFSDFVGQLDHLISAHGVGVGSGLWGIYEGQYFRGYPHGTGRLIDS